MALIETQAWLHSLDPDSLGLEGYGKKKDFYSRQCNTFSRIEAQQAVVKDHKTCESVGRAHERYDEIMDHIRSNLPRGDRCSIIHGDFKFDNVVLHPTEPRIIGILDWELSTLGHPMLDVLFTTVPFGIAEPLIRKLDPFGLVMWTLGREATKFEEGELVKVSRLHVRPEEQTS